MITISGRI